MGTDIHGYLESKWRSGWHREGEIEDGRNYRLFAALANVRNGYGFAGVPTHEPIKSIAEPRGLPVDRTKGYEDDDFGDHSFSWLSVKELIEWDGWDQVMHECGWLDRDEYATWVGTKGVPTAGWSGGVVGPGVIHADHDANDFPDGWTHVKVCWTRTLRDACRVFLAWLNYAEARTDGREARIVFGFDS